MKKQHTLSFERYSKEEWELVRLVDYLSDKFFLDKKSSASLDKLARAIKNSQAFRKRFAQTSLARLKAHLSWLIHRQAVEGKVMTYRGIMPLQIVESRDLQSLVRSMPSPRQTLQELQAAVNKQVQGAAGLKTQLSALSARRPLAANERAA